MFTTKLTFNIYWTKESFFRNDLEKLTIHIQKNETEYKN
jgi:hypothetical protein